MTTTTTIAAAQAALDAAEAAHHADAVAAAARASADARAAAAAADSTAVADIDAAGYAARDLAPALRAQRAALTITTWNTRALYTSHGQRIAATAVKGGIVFLDIDRNIDGFIPLAAGAHISDIRAQAQHNYDFGNYTSAWEHAEVLGKLAAAAIWATK